LIKSTDNPSLEVYPNTTASTATLIFCMAGILQSYQSAQSRQIKRNCIFRCKLN
jgi:hypothetical protein